MFCWMLIGNEGKFRSFEKKKDLAFNKYTVASQMQYIKREINVSPKRFFLVAHESKRYNGMLQGMAPTTLMDR